MIFVSRDNDIPRYERQLKNVDELVLRTIKEKKNIYITKKELYKILDTLYEYRVID